MIKGTNTAAGIQVMRKSPAFPGELPFSNLSFHSGP